MIVICSYKITSGDGTKIQISERYDCIRFDKSLANKLKISKTFVL